MAPLWVMNCEEKEKGKVGGLRSFTSGCGKKTHQERLASVCRSCHIIKPKGLIFLFKRFPGTSIDGFSCPLLEPQA